MTTDTGNPMLLRPIRRLLAKAFGAFGYEIRRQAPRLTLVGALNQAKQAGLQPATVLDVGAAWGSFTVTCRTVFPQARYVLIEPLQEYHSALAKLAHTAAGIEIVAAAAAAKPGEVVLHVHPDLVGTSTLLEADIAGVNGTPRAVPAVNLDTLAAKLGLAGPFLLKLDVQGAELAVLEGAQEILPLAEYVLLEVSLFEFFAGGPVLDDVVDYMRARGFVPYDVLGWQYRPIDGALAQLDMAFVKEGGRLRVVHTYATESQRQTQWTRRSG